MESLKMHTPDLAEENYRKLAEMFPNAVTETIDENGEIIRAIDADVLRQEISATVVEGSQERYQFNWPDKKKSVVLANQAIAKTLRLDREKSVGRDGTPGSIDTENIYIEGDNLDALKLLQETYLGKIKVIYIDPPYNTGSDSFVYDDDRSISEEEFSELSGQRDEYGNLLYDMKPNNESNGRFHTDWLNMMYPRLRLAKDFLTEDGLIFISINDKEIQNLKKICLEIFGSKNEVATLIWDKNHSAQAGIYKIYHEYILVFAKNIEKVQKPNSLTNDVFEAGAMKKVSGRHPASEFTFPAGTRFDAPDGTVISDEYGDVEKVIVKKGALIAKDKKLEEDVTLEAGFTQINQMRQYFYGDRDTLVDSQGQKIVEFYLTAAGKVKVVKERSVETLQTTCKFGTQGKASNELAELFEMDECPFSSPKPVGMIEDFLIHFTRDQDIVMDFFSGSATTAHAVMKVNAEHGMNLRYILVQLQENLDESLKHAQKDAVNTLEVGINLLDQLKKEHTICEIGEERIRRAGKKIKEEFPNSTADLDVGFRVFRVDDSNMKDVYYRPSDYDQGQTEMFAENIKEDRTPEDLLIQVMLDLGISLSSKIEEIKIAGKRVFSVEDGMLLACFDAYVTEEVVKAIAQWKPSYLEHPAYAVFRDSGLESDSVLTNFEQIFETYSPETHRRVL